MDPNDEIGVKEAANLLRVSPGTVRDWADSGMLEHFRMPGGARRFTRRTIAEFLGTQMLKEPCMTPQPMPQAPLVPPGFPGAWPQMPPAPPTAQTLDQLSYPREKLLATVRENRIKHEKTYTTAVEDWKKRVAEWTEVTRKKLLEVAAAAPAEDKVSIFFDVPMSRCLLPKPTSHLDDYDRAIKQLEMTSAAEIELDSRTFSKLALDEWDWRAGFAAYVHACSVPMIATHLNDHHPMVDGNIGATQFYPSVYASSPHPAIPTIQSFQQPPPQDMVDAEDMVRMALQQQAQAAAAQAAAAQVKAAQAAGAAKF